MIRKKRREDYGEALKSSYTTVDADWSENVEDDPLVPTVHAIARAADKRKAGDITALRVSHLTVTTEFFVNMVGNSRPQNQAIAAAVEEELKALGRTARHEGTADSGCVNLKQKNESTAMAAAGHIAINSSVFDLYLLKLL